MGQLPWEEEEDDQIIIHIMKEEAIMVNHHDMTKEAITILTIHGINIYGFRLSENALPNIHTYSYLADAKKSTRAIMNFTFKNYSTYVVKLLISALLIFIC